MVEQFFIDSENVCRSLRKSVFFLQTAIDVSGGKDVLRHLLIVAAQWRYSQPVLTAILCHISSAGNNNFRYFLCDKSRFHEQFMIIGGILTCCKMSKCWHHQCRPRGKASNINIRFKWWSHLDTFSYFRCLEVLSHRYFKVIGTLRFLVL